MFEERASKIISYIESKGTASISELAAALDTSESTVRRDIGRLDELGRLKKVYGGAARIGNSFFTDEFDVETKSGINKELKTRIAEYAAGLIHNDDLVYIDAGTTTLSMIPFIKAPNAVFVTNGIAHAKMLTQAGLKTYITGGQLKLVTEAVVGHDAVRFIEKYNFTKCFMGTNGVDLVRGFTTPDIDEASIKEAAVKRAYVAYVLADSSKFGQVSSVTFAEIGKACIITDSLADDTYKQKTVVKVVE